jgi:hypothetical protein
MVRNAKRRMVNEDESPIGGETLDREKLPVSKFLRNPHLTVNMFVVPDSARSNTNNSSLFNRLSNEAFRVNKSIRLYSSVQNRGENNLTTDSAVIPLKSVLPQPSSHLLFELRNANIHSLFAPKLSFRVRIPPSLSSAVTASATIHVHSGHRKTTDLYNRSEMGVYIIVSKPRIILTTCYL